MDFIVELRLGMLGTDIVLCKPLPVIALFLRLLDFFEFPDCEELPLELDLLSMPTLNRFLHY